ncbi:Type II/IV secretion system protein TadC, associated with Flp pilus assembly [hydrothermal vent metagenome]|uniref:Type II/IV secretion system protein TadC, associated with Flp pilus assembly n=1 Tax=hydrothermal vent metagenome TaxID=652676 RepID=A0A3B0SM29_9ZZZZ
MFELLASLLEIQNAITVLVAISVFGTVLMFAAPIMQGDTLRTRMKAATTERQQMRASRSKELKAGNTRLREKPKGTINQIVETLNLRKLFEAEESRIRLRAAGLRKETHLVTFLGARLIAPIVVGIIVFVYSSTVFADRISPVMRISAMMFGAIVGFYLPNIFLKNLVAKRQASIQAAWSDALDLLLICVEAGMSIEAALNRVSSEIGMQSPPLAEELTLTNAELSYLGDRIKAFDNLGKRTNMETVKSVTTSLIQSERYGTSLGSALRVLAQENRDLRMQMAEKKAASLPPKLTVPMVLFFLPVVFVVLLGPAIILAFYS